MGGRGSSSGIIQETEASKNYVIFNHGQITRYEAGTIYRAYKNGDITIRPETTQELYNQTKDYIAHASRRYNQDYIYYDRIYSATKAILNNDFKTAQEELTLWEERNIRQSVNNKSRWYKYKINK